MREVRHRRVARLRVSGAEPSYPCVVWDLHPETYRLHHRECHAEGLLQVLSEQSVISYMPTGVYPRYTPEYCIAPFCFRRPKARSLCDLHYQRVLAGIPFDKPYHFNYLNKKGWILHGYRWICAPDGREMLEHRYVMEEYLGRRLGIDEVVHHINGDKIDNQLENLEVMSRAEHTIHHCRIQTACSICGRKPRCRNLCSTHYARWKRSLGSG